MSETAPVSMKRSNGIASGSSAAATAAASASDARPRRAALDPDERARSGSRGATTKKLRSWIRLPRSARRTPRRRAASQRVSASAAARSAEPARSQPTRQRASSERTPRTGGRRGRGRARPGGRGRSEHDRPHVVAPLADDAVGAEQLDSERPRASCARARARLAGGDEAVERRGTASVARSGASNEREEDRRGRRSRARARRACTRVAKASADQREQERAAAPRRPLEHEHERERDQEEQRVERVLGHDRAGVGERRDARPRARPRRATSSGATRRRARR